MQISYIGVTQTPPASVGPDSLAYQLAKHRADLAIEASGVDWAIVRPGTLTNEPGSGLVSVGALERSPVSRENVALVLAKVLVRQGMSGVAFDLLDGDTTVARALDELA